ncbi:Putative DNA-binding domain-containing protein [Roseovarius pacificus]|uniref:Putative DNA-binding domain-containing protein n=1 Tax=Roseovarius pacificus TaxID=337701 RepID=A0A1M6Y569_9RHOB|nr:DNA-binding domain-containing protein [Roseovarius pacificus]GGO51328.1 DUF2063 domain-containing protein [Roseovarius pacificus]SHL13406.1 Putative DNA-binding domain-containing protein [Roseovarius pacificus]
MSLTQTRFHDALLTGAQLAPDGLSDGQGRPAGRRFDVYRNNVAVSLTEALEQGFPAVRNLIGPDRFKSMAGRFLRQHPPETPMIMHYGAAFPAFLEAAEPLAHIGYLGDVARLEQAQREAYHAADATPVDAAALSALPPDDLVRSLVRFAPALRLIRSAWPVLAIWRYATEPGTPKPAAIAQDVLITRPDFDPELTDLPQGGASFVTALMNNSTLSAALDTALSDAPDFDLQNMLGLLLQRQAIAAITPSE